MHAFRVSILRPAWNEFLPVLASVVLMRLGSRDFVELLDHELRFANRFLQRPAGCQKKTVVSCKTQRRLQHEQVVRDVEASC